MSLISCALFLRRAHTFNKILENEKLKRTNQNTEANKNTNILLSVNYSVTQISQLRFEIIAYCDSTSLPHKRDSRVRKKELIFEFHWTFLICHTIYLGRLASITSCGRDCISLTMAKAKGTRTTSSSFTTLDFMSLCSSSLLVCKKNLG